MINLTKLYFGQEGDWGSGSASPSPRFSKPVVVWTPTRRCNYACTHCASASEDHVYAGELSTRDAFTLLDSLAAGGTSRLHFWGGEPLYRPDLEMLTQRAAGLGLRVTLDSNGALMTAARAQGLREAGMESVGIALKGSKALHDRWRGVAGAYEDALRGIRLCRQAGLAVTLRFALDPESAGDLNRIFEVADREGVERICFYHPVYGGRGWDPGRARLSAEETRVLLIQILHDTKERLAQGKKLEVFTENQPADGPFLMLKLAKNHPERAEKIGEWLYGNGPNRAGVETVYLDPAGNVHPDPFWRSPLGNALKRPFGEIWQDENNRVLQFLRDSSVFLKGRCAACAFLKECGGGLRSRALAAYGDPMAEDPECYLSDEEIRWGMVGVY